MSRLWIVSAVVLLLAAALTMPQYAPVLARHPDRSEVAKKHCKTVVKKVRGHKKKVLVCTGKLKKKHRPVPPTGTPKATFTETSTSTPTSMPVPTTAISAGSTAGCPSVASTASPVPSAPSPHTLLWLSGLYPDAVLPQLSRMQQYHINGFMYDNHYNGLHDDFLNGGVGRLPHDDYCKLFNQTQTIVSAARSRGITDIFLRLLADVYVPSRPRVTRYTFDIFDPVQQSAFQQTVKNQAEFARAAGLKGIWLDMEPYDFPYYWRQDQDSSMLAYGRAQSDVEAQYFKTGQLLEQTALSAYPGIQIMLSPGGGYSRSGPESLYEYYGWFYAGMVQAAQAASANGFVIATEAGFGISDLNSFHGIYNYEEGSAAIGGNYSLFHDALQSYDLANHTGLLSWQLAHSTVSLPSWPYRDGSRSPVAHTTMRYPLETFQQIIKTERSLSPQYTWIYSETDGWLQSSYTCAWPPGGITTSSLACPGLVLRDTLPLPSVP